MWDKDGGQLLSLPARLLLQAGVHVLLVIQRAGETVSMPGSSPSRYDSPCAHMVHTMPSPTVLSVAGNYCSSQHLLDHIEHQWTRSRSEVLSRKDRWKRWRSSIQRTSFPRASRHRRRCSSLLPAG